MKTQGPKRIESDVEFKESKPNDKKSAIKGGDKKVAT